MGRFKQLLRQVRRAVLAAFFFSGLISLVMLAGPLFALQVFDQVIPQYDFATLLALLVLGAAAMIALFTVEAIRGTILLRAALWLDHVLGQIMLETGLNRAKTADEMDEDAASLRQLRKFLTGPGVSALLDAPFVPLFLAGLFVIHPVVGEVALLAALGLVMASVWQAGIFKDAEKMVAGGLDRREKLRHELAGAGQQIRALGLVQGGSRTWEIINRRQIAGTYRLGRRSTMAGAAARALRLAAELAIFAVGALLVMRAELTPGALVASAILVARVLAPLERLSATIADVAAARRAIKHLRAMEDDPISAQPRGAGGKARGRVKLASVSFTYPGRGAPSLTDIDLEIAPGECLVISGPAGSGKSTLTALMAGALNPSSGSVLLDASPLEHWQAGCELVPIGYLPDDALILDGTVHQNIAGFRDSTPLSVAHAAMRVGVHDLLSALPSGYDTVAGPGGRALSLRERRATGFARAAHGSPAVMVLDEPEAGRSGSEVSQLARLLQEIKADGASLVIASNEPKLRALGDTNVTLNQGTIRNRRRAGTMARSQALGAVPSMTWPGAPQERAS